MPILELNGVSKAFESDAEDLVVLSGISLAVEPGTVVSIGGASGSGKSTLLNLIAGLDAPSAGTIAVNEFRVESMSEDELTEYRSDIVGLVFQFHYLLKDFTALENVMLPAYMRGLRRPEAEERAAALLSEVGLAGRLRHYPGQLSGGERQRAAVARALINNPAIILADEPTGNLDSANSRGVENILLSAVRNRGTTLILVTHDERLAASGDVRLRLAEGRLVSP